MFFLFQYRLTSAVMTNFEFCRDSIHSKTTESCILLFLCTLDEVKGGLEIFFFQRPLAACTFDHRLLNAYICKRLATLRHFLCKTGLTSGAIALSMATCDFLPDLHRKCRGVARRLANMLCALFDARTKGTYKRTGICLESVKPHRDFRLLDQPDTT